MKDFDEFWPYYLREHNHPKNCRLHIIGMTFLHLILFYVLATGNLKVLWLAPACYCFSLAGHIFYEKHTPATLKHPLWSIVADLRLFYSFLFKKMP